MVRMSKTNKRKNSETGKQSEIRSSASNSSGRDQNFGVAGVKRQSVFERLGTKAISSRASTERTLSINTSISDALCRNWAQNGTCSYEKSCKLVHSHALISPSKRGSSIKKEGDAVVSRRQIEDDKNRVLSSCKRPSSEENAWENWDQTELEYEDEKVLEKRRAALQRELELQMKKEGTRKDLAKTGRNSSTSSRSSCSSVTSSTSSTSRSSASASKKIDDKKRRLSSSSPEPEKKKAMKSSSRKDSPSRKSGSSAGKEATRNKMRGSRGGSTSTSSPLRQHQSRKRSISPPRKPSPKTKLSSTTSDPYKGITLEVTLKNDLALRSSSARRKESPLRRGGSPDRRTRRSVSRGRRRSPMSRSSGSRRSRPRSPSRPSTSRVRTPERKKEDDRKKDDRRERKPDYREKKDSHEDARSRTKVRDLREAAREKDRLEALERCRERQREREQKEKERLREDRERKDVRRNSREISRSSISSSDKRHERGYERCDRGKGSERERSYERERVRDRALERMMERKSIERTRDRSRDRYADRSSYSDSRRLLQTEEKTYSSSPYRGSERGRYESERERLSPRDERISRSNYSEDRRGRGRSRGWPGENQPASQSSRYEDPSRERDKPLRSSSGSEWAGERGTEFQNSSSQRSRDWESNRLREEVAEDWSSYERTGTSEWLSSRQHPHLHHIDERRHQSSEPKEKDVHQPSEPSKEKDTSELLGKRGSRASEERDEPHKRPRINEPPTLEELSDISDDPDDILNRDDVEFADGDDSRMGDALQSSVGDSFTGQADRSEGNADDSLQDPSNISHRLGEDENMVGLDFEEISDEELEEESRANKGNSVGDALGVDWASLMAECRTQKKTLEENGSDKASSVRARWEPAALLERIGIASSLVSSDYLKKLSYKFPQLSIDPSKKDHSQKMSNITGMAGLQRKIAERKAKRENVIALSMGNKQALSARADIAIRRRLCGLPVISLETTYTTGLCPWAI